jgi:hypothetical protein
VPEHPPRFSRGYALALILLVLLSLSCQTTVIVVTLPAPAAVPSPLPGTPAPPPNPTFGEDIITVEVVVPTSPPLGGASVQVVTPPPTPAGPTLPRPLYFLSDRTGTTQVYLLAGDGSPAFQVTREPLDIMDYALDPDGEFLVAYTPHRLLVVYSERRSDTFQARGLDEAVRGFALSRDGEHLAFWTDARLTIYQLGPRGQSFVRFVSGEAWQPGGRSPSAAWSADGAYLAYGTSDGVRLLNVGTGQIDLVLEANPGVGYRVEGVSPDGRWIVASTYGPAGECRAQLIALDAGPAEVQTLRCPLTFSPDGVHALWTPSDAATIQVVRVAPSEQGDEDEEVTRVADYAGYAASWLTPEAFAVWTCALEGLPCPASALDLYLGAWPEGELSLRWASAPHRVRPQDGGAVPADPLWETFAVVAVGEGRSSTSLLVVNVPEDTVTVVAEEGINWAPRWLPAP